MKKIMVVDDDPGIREILKIIFERAGYQVQLETDGQFIFNTNFPLPGIILLDRFLSGMDGLDVCMHLKSHDRTRDIPVIIISASPQTAHKAFKAGADDFLEKPFDVKELLRIVEKHMRLKTSS